MLNENEFSKQYQCIFTPNSNRRVCGECKYFDGKCTTSEIEAKYGSSSTPACSEFEFKELKC